MIFRRRPKLLPDHWRALLAARVPHVDRLTPDGQLPANLGAGGLGDLAGMLGGLLNR